MFPQALVEQEATGVHRHRCPECGGSWQCGVYVRIDCPRLEIVPCMPCQRGLDVEHNILDHDMNVERAQRFKDRLDKCRARQSLTTTVAHHEAEP